MCVCETLFIPQTPSCRSPAQIKPASHHLRAAGTSWGGGWTLAANRDVSAGLSVGSWIKPSAQSLLHITKVLSEPCPWGYSSLGPSTVDEFLESFVELMSSFLHGGTTQWSASMWLLHHPESAEMLWPLSNPTDAPEEAALSCPAVSWAALGTCWWFSQKNPFCKLLCPALIPANLH